MTTPTTTKAQTDADKLLEYLGEDWDITTCAVCGEPIVVEVMTGEPQTCNRFECVYEQVKDQI